MPDHLTPNKRSWNMSRIRSGDTSPELLVRKYLYSHGVKYRIHRKNLPGKPDIVISHLKTAIFVHGCFWHQHDGCSRANLPKSKKHYWIPKLQKNTERDRINISTLIDMQWNVIVIWECETKTLENLAEINGLISRYAKSKSI